MRFTELCSVLMAMASLVYSQDQIQPVTDLNDVRPGHIADMSALPYEIVSLSSHHSSNPHQTHQHLSHQQRCIKLHVPLAWTDYPAQLDLFRDKSTGNWHKDIPTCKSEALPSSSTTAISEYETFTSHLCSGWEAPGMPLTTLLTISGTPKVSTIFPNPSKIRHLTEANSRFRTSTTSHACIWGKEYCRNEKVKHPVYETESKSSRWVKSSHRKIATSTAWMMERRPATTVAMPTK
jgi:hypothetical protein